MQMTKTALLSFTSICQHTLTNLTFLCNYKINNKINNMIINIIIKIFNVNYYE